MTTNTTVRTMHDIGLAAWFGGSLFGVTALNTAAAEAPDQRTTSRITTIGWAKWAPINAAAVGVHLIGGAGLLNANRKRALLQKGTTASTVTKLAVTGAALAATAYTRLLGKKVEDAVVHASCEVPSSATSHADPSTTRQGADTGVGHAAKEADKLAGQTLSSAAQSLPLDVTRAQRQLYYAQVAVPVLTGVLMVLTARQGEEQRPGAQIRGIAQRAGAAVGLDV